MLNKLDQWLSKNVSGNNQKAQNNTTQNQAQPQNPASPQQPANNQIQPTNQQNNQNQGERKNNRPDFRHRMKNFISNKQDKKVNPPPNMPNPSNKLKVIPLGGVDDTTKNLVVYEYGNDIILIDCGIAFPAEDMPGVDYLIPDVDYLMDKRDKIRGLIITHGHMDHYGSIPWILPKLGANLPIYASDLAAAMIKERQKEYGGRINLNVYSDKTKLHLGHNFEIEFYRVNHNVPSSYGVVVKTPVGLLIQTGDWKFDHSPPGNEPAADVGKIASLGTRGVLAVFADSTNAYAPGYQKSESDIKAELDKIFQQATGRIISTLFSSHLGRIQQLVSLAEKYGRKVVFDGMSIRKNAEIMRKLGYLQCKRGTILDRTEFRRIPRDKVLAILPGAGGQHESAMARVSRGEHQYIFIEAGDTAVLTSSVVPGTARMVESLIDDLYRRGAEVIDCQVMDIHAGGHAKQEELKMLLRLLKPKYVIPFFGNYSHRVIHGRLAHAIGIPKKNIFIVDEGQVLEFSSAGEGRISDQIVQTKLLAVDGNRVNEIGEQVMKDRQALAAGGVFMVIFKV
ncbi:MAG: ribonuclease J, partial [Patescibacteria group bacterium]|nr:ribonuclease J [Patescibacteria group bacterium]